MLLRRFHVSMRTLAMAVASVALVLVGGGAAEAANQGNPPLLVPYNIQTVAGTPQFAVNKANGPSGYGGDGGLATPAPGFCDQASGANSPGAAGCPTLANPYGVAIDSVGNVYFTDSGNNVIREVNAETGVLDTVAGEDPKGCSGTTCSNKFTGCSDGVAALGSPIGGPNSGLTGIAVDAYGNIYFGDAALDAVWVVYRGGAQVANFIALVDNATVASASQVQIGYVYHIAGALPSCVGNPGNTDAVLATQAGFRGPRMISLDSAGNIYIADTGNFTTRVINTQATAQTFFQYTVQPGFIQSIIGCNAALTVDCPAVTTTLVGTGINGPANAVVQNSQVKGAEADQYGNVYQFNGTGGGTGAPGIYMPVAYAGGAPLTTLLTVEAPMIAQFYGPNSAASQLPPGTPNAPAELPLQYGNAYPVIGDPASPNGLSLIQSPYIEQAVNSSGGFDVRPSDVTADIFGTLYFEDNHYPYIERVDQFTQTTLFLVGNQRNEASLTFTGNPPTGSIKYLNLANFGNRWYCVYGSGSNPWLQGPQETDPLGDGCPSIIANIGNHGTSSNLPQIKADGPGDVFMTDASNNIIRELYLGNLFPATPLAGSASPAPVTRAIQVHFDVSNPPIPVPGNFPASVGNNVYLAENSGSNGNVPVFSIVGGGGDFTIDTTTPEFAIGTLGPGGYANNVTTTNFGMWSGLPTCYRFATSVNDSSYDCLVYVKFNPTAPGLRTAQLVATTLNGSTYNFSLTGTGQGGQLAVDGGQQTPFATAGIGSTSAVAVSPTGVVYIADAKNNRITACPAGQAPCGTPTTLPQPASLKPATLSGPMGVATDAAGNVYISDTGNNRVLEYDPITAVWTQLGGINWISGGNAPGSTVPAYAFKGPEGLAVDKFGNVYVADTGNGKVVEIPQNTALGGATPLFQYTGGPTFVAPTAVAVDANANIYVADPQSPTVAVQRFPAGGGDLQAAANDAYSVFSPNFDKRYQVPSVSNPTGVAVDGAGNVYVSDPANGVWVYPSATANAKPYELNFTGLASAAGLALDAAGNLYVADAGSEGASQPSQVVYSNRQNPIINFGAVPQDSPVAGPVCPTTVLSDGFNNSGTASGACPIVVTNTGTQAVALTNPLLSVPSPNAAFTVTNTNCSNVGSLLPGQSCVITATFQPTSDGPQTETVNINGTTSMALVATTNAVGANPQVNIALSSSAGLTPAVGTASTITATVTQPHIPGNTPSGTVTFSYTIAPQNTPTGPVSCGAGGSATVPLNGSGVATYTMPAAAQGLIYTVSANYNGDSLNSATQAVPLVLTAPPITESFVASSVSYAYGQKVPTLSVVATPALPSGVTATAVAGGLYAPSSVTAGPQSPVADSPYPIQVEFAGANACAYGHPVVLTSGGQPAVVTEAPAPLTMTIPAFTTVYGAAAVNFYSTSEISGAVGTDINQLSATFTPVDTSVLDVLPAPPQVNPYPVVPTLTGLPITAGDYTVKYVNGTDTVTPAGSAITVTQTATSVAIASENTATAQLLVSTQVTNGKGNPTGTITVTDNFVPITGTVFGPPCNVNLTTNCNSSQVLPACSSSVTANCINPTVTLSGATATFSLPVAVLTGATPTLPGTHNFTFTYSGDAGTNGDGKGDFQCSVSGGAAANGCASTQAVAFSLVVDYPDINLTSNTGPLIIVPGVTPSGLGLPSAPGQNSAYPETAAISINPILGFSGTVTLSCTTQNPTYVSCSMLPPSVCFNSGGTAGCTKNNGSATVILSVSTPATLPIGFKTSELRLAAGKTALAFLPLGMLAFCFRRRKRLGQALLALMVLVGMSAGMSGCSGGNQATFYTPVPAGPQSVTVTATYQSTGNFCSSATATCAVTRAFVVPINID